jgi:hypothetical protein
MDNQHQQIKGYRDLTQGEIDLMNEIKAKGMELEALIGKVTTHLEVQVKEVHQAENAAELARLERAEPRRWLAMARTDFQAALMKLTRAVAQPTTF